ncbi:MAG: hypothetical protein HC790_00410 [Acaryochloridaceae cyanobacterium CSU_3_4]|nr:hypothetical protein [Acaryochloridaceae cyanobacterium CSU_3_4]
MFLPDELTIWMLGQWSGLSVSALTLENWIQVMGSKAQQALETQLEAQGRGIVLSILQTIRSIKERVTSNSLI